MHTRDAIFRAFTLIELIVVIAIVMLLLALLMPSLKQARDVGQIVACASNLRQLHVAWIGYAQSNFGALSTESRWVGQAGGYLAWTVQDNIESGQLFTHAGEQHDVYLCPTFERVYACHEAFVQYTPACGYSINTIFTNRDLFGRPRIERLHQVRFPGELMVFSDENTWCVPAYSSHGLNDNAIVMGNYDNPTHLVDAIGSFHASPGGDLNDGKSNVVFVEGHVALHHISETKELTWPRNLRP